LVKGYLGGQFGGNASDVSAKTASLFFALDRYASMKTEDWINADIVIADRYISSNMVHQAAKISDRAEKDEFLGWLDDLETNILGIPRASKVIFLDVKPDVSLKLRAERGELKNGQSKDIHESDVNFMTESYNNAIFCASRMKWDTVDCCDGDLLRSRESIAEDIYSIAISIIR
jgi:dTMP kinase